MTQAREHRHCEARAAPGAPARVEAIQAVGSADPALNCVASLAMTPAPAESAPANRARTLRRARVKWLFGLWSGVAVCFGAIAGLAGAPASAGPVQDYTIHCQGCHLPEGQGMAGKVPNMRGEVAKFLHVPGGRDFLIRVPGVATSRLSDRETAELMNWLVSAFDPEHLPKDFEAYTVEEVAALRDKPLTDVRKRRRELIEAMEEERRGSEERR